MGWKQFLHQVEALSRQRQREARASVRRIAAYQRAVAQQQRSEARTAAQMQKQREREAAEVEAAQYEGYVAQLTSLHAECSEAWNWRAVTTSVPPVEPIRQNPAETAARAALQAHSPGLIDKLFGGAKQQRARLEEAIQCGFTQDQQQYDAAMHDYRTRHHHWTLKTNLAPGVLSLHPEACRSALRYTGSFDALEELGSRVVLEGIDQNAAILSCSIEDQEIVPSEEVKLTASGKLSSKEMPAGRYWALFQDHLASCAIRIARELYSVTPIDRVIVNVRVAHLDPSTGHMVRPTFLAVHFTRDALMRLNFNAIDPSEALKNFPHRMKFKKASGFDPVEAMSADEQWITT